MARRCSGVYTYKYILLQYNINIQYVYIPASRILLYSIMLYIIMNTCTYYIGIHRGYNIISWSRPRIRLSTCNNIIYGYLYTRSKSKTRNNYELTALMRRRRRWRRSLWGRAAMTYPNELL